MNARIIKLADYLLLQADQLLGACWHFLGKAKRKYSAIIEKVTK